MTPSILEVKASMSSQEIRMYFQILVACCVDVIVGLGYGLFAHKWQAGSLAIAIGVIGIGVMIWDANRHARDYEA